MKLKNIVSISMCSLVIAGCGGQDPGPIPENTPPTISGPNSVSVPENTASVASLSISDVDGNPLTISLSGADAASFNVSESGDVRFGILADFESPSDADANNIYTFTITVTDTYTAPVSHELTVEVTDVENDEPERYEPTLATSATPGLTTDEFTFSPESLIESFETPIDIVQAQGKFIVTGIFADGDVAANGWSNFNSAEGAQYVGVSAASTCEIDKAPGNCDGPTGTISIFDVEITQPYLQFLMSGGNGSNDVGISVFAPIEGESGLGQMIGSFTPNTCGDPFIKGDQHWVHFDVSALVGQTVNLKIFDNESAGCGFLAFDHLYQTANKLGTEAGVLTAPEKTFTATNVSFDAVNGNEGLLPGGSFESVADTLSKGWLATGAFAASQEETAWEGTSGIADFDPAPAKIGDRAVSTCEINSNLEGCDAPTGTLTSPIFQVTNNYLQFLLTGGFIDTPVGVRLLDTAENTLLTFLPGKDPCWPPHVDGDDDWTYFDLTNIRDAYVRVQFFDEEVGGCGFAGFDHVYQTDELHLPDTARNAGTAVVQPTLGFNVTVNAQSFEQVIGSFDNALTTDWVGTGAFENPQDEQSWQGVSGVAHVGARAISTCEINNNAEGCDAPTGTLTSPAFEVMAERPVLSLLLAGGNGEAAVGVRVLDANDDSELASIVPNSCGPAAIDGDDDWQEIDLSAYIGSSVKVEIYDNEPGGCGFISFDHVHMKSN